MSDLINILSIIDDKSQLINFPKLDPNSFKPAVLTLIQRLKDTVKTGDHSSVLLLFGIVVVAGIVAGGVIYWRKKKAKK